MYVTVYVCERVEVRERVELRKSVYEFIYVRMSLIVCDCK